jgi:hypothetical protein
MKSSFRQIFAFVLLFVSISSLAEEAPTKQEVQKPSDQVKEALSQTKDRRANSKYVALLNYSPVDLLIPSKIGFTLGLVNGTEQTWDFEYLKGTVSVPFVVEDLGKMTDTRYSLIGRSYLGNNSFNFSYGLSYFDFSLHLGDKLLNSLSGGNYPSIDVVQIQAVGFNVGFGNRWVFDKNITFGVDWISWAQPVSVTKKNSAFLDYATNQEDRDDVEKAIKSISYFPRLAFFKLQFGMSF